MKNNLIGAIAGWKSAALLALVAMVAAVAFSGVLTTQTADADVGGFSFVATFDDNDSTDPSGAEAITDGDTLTIAITATGDDGDTWAYMVDRPEGAGADTTCTTGAAIGSGGTATETLSAITVAGVGTPNDDSDDVSIAGKYTVRVVDGACDATDSTMFPAGATVLSKSITVLNVPSNPSSGPGSSALVSFTTAMAAPLSERFRISDDSSSTATFGENGRTSLACADNAACDQNGATGLITLRVNIAASSGAGEVFVQRVERATGEFTVESERTISVSSAVPVARVTVDPAAKSIAATGGTSEVTVTAYDSRGNALGGQTVVITAAGGTTTGGPGTCTGGVLGCSAKTDADSGQVTVTINGGHVPGTASVVASVGGVSRTIEIKLFGQAASISLAADGPSGSALTGGGAPDTTWVIATITDAAGNGVAGQSLAAIAATGPDNSATAVTTTSVARPAVPTAGILTEIPGCDDPTDSNGQCALQVTAGLATTLGTHTITVTGPDVIKVDDRKAETAITVAGKATSLTAEGPSRVDYLTESTINVTLTDDDGVPAGNTAVTVTQVSGSGAVLGTIDSKVTTVNGAASFKFLSANRADDVVILVRAGSLQETVSISVGPVVEEEPEAPPATWNNELVSGQNVVVWNGADGAAPSEGAADGVSAIWSYDTGSGSWDGYFPDAADVPGGNTLGSLSSNQAYVVIVN